MASRSGSRSSTQSFSPEVYRYPPGIGIPEKEDSPPRTMPTDLRMEMSAFSVSPITFSCSSTSTACAASWSPPSAASRIMSKCLFSITTRPAIVSHAFPPPTRNRSSFESGRISVSSLSNPNVLAKLVNTERSKPFSVRPKPISAKRFSTGSSSVPLDCAMSSAAAIPLSWKK